MNVRELIELLQGYPDDIEVLMSIVVPAESDDEDEIVTDLYTVEASLLYPDDDSGAEVLWLVGGEDEDVERLLDELDDDLDGDHAGHDHD